MTSQGCFTVLLILLAFSSSTANAFGFEEWWDDIKESARDQISEFDPVAAWKDTVSLYDSTTDYIGSAASSISSKIPGLMEDSAEIIGSVYGHVSDITGEFAEGIGQYFDTTEYEERLLILDMVGQFVENPGYDSGILKGYSQQCLNFQKNDEKRFFRDVSFPVKRHFESSKDLDFGMIIETIRDYDSYLYDYERKLQELAFSNIQCVLSGFFDTKFAFWVIEAKLNPIGTIIEWNYLMDDLKDIFVECSEEPEEIIQLFEKFKVNNAAQKLLFIERIYSYFKFSSKDFAKKYSTKAYKYAKKAFFDDDNKKKK